LNISIKELTKNKSTNSRNKQINNLPSQQDQNYQIKYLKKIYRTKDRNSASDNEQPSARRTYFFMSFLRWATLWIAWSRSRSFFCGNCVMAPNHL